MIAIIVAFAAIFGQFAIHTISIARLTKRVDALTKELENEAERRESGITWIQDYLDDCGVKMVRTNL